MAGQLLGTDGIRGRAAHFLTADLAREPARTAVARLNAPRSQVLIIRDTRESGEMVESAIAREHAGLAGRGRVLVRPSGTEPLIRVMVEAPGQQGTDEICNRLRRLVETALAASGEENGPGGRKRSSRLPRRRVAGLDLGVARE